MATSGIKLSHHFVEICQIGQYLTGGKTDTGIINSYLSILSIFNTFRIVNSTRNFGINFNFVQYLLFTGLHSKISKFFHNTKQGVSSRSQTAFILTA
jgi:hypothetical protein